MTTNEYVVILTSNVEAMKEDIAAEKKEFAEMEALYYSPVSKEWEDDQCQEFLDKKYGCETTIEKLEKAVKLVKNAIEVLNKKEVLYK